MADLDSGQINRLVQAINEQKKYFLSQEIFEKTINSGTMAKDIADLKKSFANTTEIQNSLAVGNKPKTFVESLHELECFAGYTLEEYTKVVEEGLNSSKKGSNLYKSFVTGDASSPGSLALLVKENLDPLMVDVQINETHMTLYNSIAKTPTPTRESERPRLLQRGSGAGRGFTGFPEGRRPKIGGGDRVDRLAFNLTQQGVVGSSTEFAKATGSHMTENPMMFEHRNRIIQLLSILNNMAFFGDRTIHKAPDGSELEFDGILKIMEDKLPSHIIDLKGAMIDTTVYYKAAQMITDDGLIDDLTGRFDVIQHHSLSNQISISMDDKQRSILDGAIGRTLVPGSRVPGLMTNSGYLGFKNTRTLKGVENEFPVTSENTVEDVINMGNYAPTVAEHSETDAKMTAQNYSYAIAAINEKGESVPVIAKKNSSKQVAVTANSGKAVQITMPDTSAMRGIVAFNIYRYDGGSNDNDTILKKSKWIARVGVAASAPTVYIDKNQSVPDTHYSVIKSTDRNDIDMGQLLPLLKKAYYDPEFASSNLFMLMLITCVRIWTPERIVIIKNAKGLEIE